MPTIEPVEYPYINEFHREYLSRAVEGFSFEMISQTANHDPETVKVLTSPSACKVYAEGHATPESLANISEKLTSHEFKETIKLLGSLGIAEAEYELTMIYIKNPAEGDVLASFEARKIYELKLITPQDLVSAANGNIGILETLVSLEAFTTYKLKLDGITMQTLARAANGDIEILQVLTSLNARSLYKGVLGITPTQLTNAADGNIPILKELVSRDAYLIYSDGRTRPKDLVEKAAGNLETLKKLMLSGNIDTKIEIPSQLVANSADATPQAQMIAASTVSEAPVDPSAIAAPVAPRKAVARSRKPLDAEALKKVAPSRESPDFIPAPKTTTRLIAPAAGTVPLPSELTDRGSEIIKQPAALIGDGKTHKESVSSAQESKSDTTSIGLHPKSGPM